MLEQLRSQGLTDYRAFFQPFGSAVDPRLWPDLPSGRAVREGISVSFAATRADGFGEDERTTLRALASPLTVAVKVAVGLEMAETLLGTYLGATSGLSVMRREVRRGQGRVIHAVIWYSDLRGSTALAESLPLEAYLATLNTYFDCIPDAVAGQGGEPRWSAMAGGMTF
jgi:adenylate cyclase